jgi:urease accessory protein
MKMKSTAFLILTLASTTALAHPQAGGGLIHGFVHPFTGVDHLAAMLVVGLWAARYGGFSRLVLPVAFLASMLVGALVAGAGILLPGMEAMVLASVAVFAWALAFPMRLTLAAGLVAAFGFVHGFVHIVELPAEAAFTLFSAGMLAGTALLHAIGLAVGLAIALRRPRLA